MNEMVMMKEEEAGKRRRSRSEAGKRKYEHKRLSNPQDRTLF
jgi:hypothetical protein